MKIDSIFAVVNNNLIAVKYDNYEIDEFERLFDNWTDINYLYDFFSEHIDDLNAGFYGKITIDKAIEKTVEDAERLERKLIKIAELGQTEQYENLQTCKQFLNH